jgi:hypothetical protein
VGRRWGGGGRAGVSAARRVKSHVANRGGSAPLCCSTGVATRALVPSHKFDRHVSRQRWESWLWTCVFALLPLLLWWLLVQIIGVEGKTGAVDASRELLFFSLTMCTLALSELRNVHMVMRRRSGYESLFYASIVVIAGSAALYGVFLSVHSSPTFVSRIFTFSIGAAVIGFGVGTCTQIFVHGGDAHAAVG